MNYDIITILGPTASGKTNLATRLAYKIGGEIISADSRQVFKGMDIGTGKDIEEYEVKGKLIPYHLIDIVNPGEIYNVFRYAQDFGRVYEAIKQRNNIPILCGGTGLYISAVTQGYDFYDGEPDEDLRKELEKKDIGYLQQKINKLGIKLNESDFYNKRRLVRHIEAAISKNKRKHITLPALNTLYIGVSIDKETRRKKIHKRLIERLQNGMIEEVDRLLKEVGKDVLISYGLEYRYVTLYLIGKMNYDDMIIELERAINRFAKRQMTWLRGMERKGIKINWINIDMPTDEKIKIIKELADF